MQPPRGIERVVRDLMLGAVVGVLSGVGSYVFLRSLSWATDTRTEHGWLLFLLPFAGFVVGYAYLHFGGEANRGTNLILDELHDPTDAGPPLRMAPMVLIGSTITHLFGGSSGREGAAVQIAASLTSLFRRFLAPSDRRAVIIAAVAGGFGSVFGVPAAGTVFAIEVPTVGRQRYEHLPAALAAAFVGDRVTRGLGIHHHDYGRLTIDLDLASMAAVAVASIAFGWCAAVFIELTHIIRRRFSVHVRYSPLHPMLGGVVVIALTGIVGTRSYLGLSLPLINVALGGSAVVFAAFAWKLIFTSVTLGSGFPGGEVTPLFCMGACLGSVLAGPLGLQSGALAGVGMVAVFAAASNTPLACTLLGVELFPGTSPVVFLIATLIATAMSGDRSVYGRQRIERSVRGGDAAHATMAEADAMRVDSWSRTARDLRARGRRR